MKNINETRIRNLLTVLVVILIIIAIFFLQSKKAGPGRGEIQNTPVAELGGVLPENALNQIAPEISTPDGFINVDDITIAGELAKGNIVLIDYWTYSCINCQRTTPFLNDWHEKYSDKGLTIIGIHTPEFEFEKDYDNVVDAVERFEIKFPVVLDNDYSTWRAYNNRYWPRKYLIDTDGTIVYDHIGEGAYEETEEMITKLLKKAKKLDRRYKPTMIQEEPEMTVGEYPRSRETYLGYERIEYFANPVGEHCVDTTCDYEAPDEVSVGTYVFDGKWNIQGERSVLSEKNGSIKIHFAGKTVNLVAESLSGDDIAAEVLLNGKPIAGNAGKAVSDSSVIFNESKLYNLVDLKTDGGIHVLEIKLENAKDFAGYAFTFG